MKPAGKHRGREEGNRDIPGKPSSSVDIPGTFPLISSVEDFIHAGNHIFGVHGWLRQTARCLGVKESTVWRWANEQTPIKPYALAAMSAWLRLFALTGERPPHADAEPDGQ